MLPLWGAPISNSSEQNQSSCSRNRALLPLLVAQISRQSRCTRLQQRARCRCKAKSQPESCQTL
eukprot:4855008-Amphidinium_carterae.1